MEEVQNLPVSCLRASGTVLSTETAEWIEGQVDDDVRHISKHWGVFTLLASWLKASQREIYFLQACAHLSGFSGAVYSADAWSK